MKQKWTFPLTKLELSLEEIRMDVLKEQQDRHYQRMMADEYRPY